MQAIGKNYENNKSKMHQVIKLHVAGFFHTGMIKNSVLNIFSFKYMSSFQKHITQLLEKLAVNKIITNDFQRFAKKLAATNFFLVGFQKRKLYLTSK